MLARFTGLRTISSGRLSVTIVAFVVASSASSARAQAQNRPAEVEHVSLDRTEPGLRSFEQGLRPTVLGAGETAPDWSIQERMAYYNVPGVAVAILKDGKVAFSTGYGVRAAGSQVSVNANTLFSVGSISKIVTAATTLRLVAESKLDLDRSLDDYLTSWHIPTSPDFPDAVVTLRMLMSHTAGLNVHGFADYLPNEPLPTLVQTLNGMKPAKNAPVRLMHKPASRFDYSGGGVQVEQQVIEDVTGSSLEIVAKRQVFGPLGMRRSTFTNPLPAAHGNIAKAHDWVGKLAALPRGWQTFPEQAASGLWTSANDLGKFVGALIRSFQGTGDFLPQSIGRDMMTRVSPSWHGLGPRLDGAGATYYFHHGGANASYRAFIEGHLETGEGLVILTNGSNGDDLYNEIRNAVSDMLDWSSNPPLYTIDLGPDPSLADFAGTYRVDETMPMNLRQALAEAPDVQEIQVADGQVSVYFPGSTERIALLPLTPTRFVHLVAGRPRQHVFHREADGSVNGFALEMGAARAYYRRPPPR